MTRFKKSGGQVLITLADYEEAVLESLVEQLIELLEGDGVQDAGGDSFAQWEAEMAAPGGMDTSDPVIARLFPPANRDDPAADAEFRRFTEAAQRRTRIEQAELVLDALRETNAGRDPAIMRTIDADAWLKTISALRLSLAVRLGIEVPADIEALEQLGEHEPQAVLYGMYEWIGYFLEGLLGKLP